MPKKLVKKFVEEVVAETVKDVIKEPGKMVKRAIEGVGFMPMMEEETLTPEQLAEKKKKDEVMRRRRLAQIREETKQVVAERKAARIRTLQAAEMARQKAEEPKKPFVSPAGKKPRGFLAGIRARQQKSQPELVGRRASG